MKNLQVLALFLTFSMTFILQSAFAASHEKTIATETDKIIEAMTGDNKEATSTENTVEEKVEEAVKEKASEESTATKTEASEENKEVEDEEPDCD